MKKTIFYTIILNLLAFTIVNIHGVFGTTSYNDYKCEVNEIYQECGSACPPSCSDLFYPQQSRICTDQCVPGCFCKPELYRSVNDECVKPEECCQGRNEEYRSCGTACPETCFDSGPRPCILVCVSGCFCKTGFVRRDNTTNSPCIRRRRCNTYK